jgi:hypothetical protein
MLRFRAIGVQCHFKVFVLNSYLVKPSAYLKYLCQIRNLGGKLGKTLSTQFEVKTVGELEHISLGKFIRALAFQARYRLFLSFHS